MAVSNDKPDVAQKTQADFPHLIVVSDAQQNLAKAVDVIHPRMGPNGEDTNVATTFLVDGKGNVKKVLRPDRFITRFTPQELAAAIDKYLEQGS
jgi:peroxiredoxin